MNRRLELFVAQNPRKILWERFQGYEFESNRSFLPKGISASTWPAAFQTIIPAEFPGPLMDNVTLEYSTFLGAGGAGIVNHTLELCGPLYQVIGHIDGTGDATASDQIVVVLNGNSWNAANGKKRVQVQAISSTAIQMFTGVPLRYIWEDQLHCYISNRNRKEVPPEPVPEPIPDPIIQSFQVFFDTGKNSIQGGTLEFENRLVINDILSDLELYGPDPRVDEIKLEIVGHASPRWRAAGSSAEAALENAMLAEERANNIEQFIRAGYAEFQGPIPLVVVDIDTSSIIPEDEESELPIDQLDSEGRGSSEGLSETGDPDDNSQIYRRADILLTITFASAE